jgi:hypothetical protein
VSIGTTVAFTSSVGARLPGVLAIVLGQVVGVDLIAEFNAIATADSTVPYLVTSPVINTLVDNSDVVGFWVLRDPTGIPAPDADGAGVAHRGLGVEDELRRRPRTSRSRRRTAPRRARPARTGGRRRSRRSR